MVAQWLRGVAAEAKDGGAIPAAVDAVQVDAKTKNACVKISPHIKDLRVIRNPSQRRAL